MSVPPSSPSANSNSSDKQGIKRKRSSFADVLKILVVGTENVGKSALVVRFITKKFIGEYGSTTDTKYRHSEIVDNDHVLVEIADTCCRSNNDLYTSADNIRWADGFVLVYSITDRNSFTYIDGLKTKIFEVKRTNQLPIFLIANKTDMDHMRKVASHEGESYAQENNFIFRELSTAEHSEAVRQLFQEICRELLLTKRRSRTFLDRVFGGIGAKK